QARRPGTVTGGVAGWLHDLLVLLTAPPTVGGGCGNATTRSLGAGASVEGASALRRPPLQERRDRAQLDLVHRMPQLRPALLLEPGMGAQELADRLLAPVGEVRVHPAVPPQHGRAQLGERVVAGHRAREREAGEVHDEAERAWIPAQQLQGQRPALGETD